MSMYCLEGLPGSGKTLYAIEKIIAPLLSAKDMAGRWTPTHIYHNIEGLKPFLLCARLGVPETHEQYLHYIDEDIVNPDTGEVWTGTQRVRYFYCKPFTRQFVGYEDDEHKIKKYSYEYYPANSVFIIDETQNYFNSRDFKSEYSYEVVKYATKHRHYLHTIWWLTQSVDSVDITFRRQTEQVLVLRRLENWAFFDSSSKTQVQYYQGWDARTLAPFMKKTFAYDSRFFGTYDSYVPTDGTTNERRLKANVFLNNKGLRIVGIIILIMVILIIYNYKKNGNSLMPMPQSMVHTTTTAPPKSTGLAPDLGGAVVSEQNSRTEECKVQYKHFFVWQGQVMAVLPDGSAEPKIAGCEYEKLH